MSESGNTRRMVGLIALGLLAGLFFSTTFILNRLMSLEGGHWVWSAALRYAYMILLLTAGLGLWHGTDTLRGIFGLYIRHLTFWTLAGSIGFGGFYALLCFSADHAPGWIVATTWQLTIIATLVVLRGFGQTFHKKIWFFSTIVFFGVLLVNLSAVEAQSAKGLLTGGLPVLIAAFCYPVGNQLVWEAQHGHRRLPMIDDPYGENPFAKVLLLALGSVPFWLALLAVVWPPLPSAGQLVNTGLVALFSGIVATSLFLYARQKSFQASELAAVDATQSSEVVFALVGEILILKAPLPNGIAVSGMVLVFVGLGLFIRYQEGAG